MTEKSKLVRPSQVTMSAWMALVGSLLLVVTLFDSVSRLRTVEFRESITEFLSTQPGSGLGLDIAQVVEFLRVLMLVSGAAAAAAAVLAIYVLQRHKAARVGLTVAAAALVLTLATAAAIPDAPVSGGFLPVMIAFAAISLWTKPARDWFNGVPATEANSRTGSQSGTFGGQTPRYGLEGNLLSSENQPPNEQPEGPGAGGGRPTSGDETAPWPRMPDDTTGRPLPPPTQGFGSQQGQGGPAGPSYPQGGYPPAYGQQAPYGQQHPTVSSRPTASSSLTAATRSSTPSRTTGRLSLPVTRRSAPRPSPSRPGSRGHSPDSRSSA